MLRTFTLKTLFVVFLLTTLFGGAARACDRSDLTFLGITGPNMPFGPYTISARLCVGMGITGSTLGGDQRTNTFSFAFWSSNPSFTILSFTPASVTGPPATCPAVGGCSNIGSIQTGNFQGSTDQVRYSQNTAPGNPCSTHPYGCISSTCLCGQAQSYCTNHTFTVNVIPDSMRATGIEGAGNNVGGCYPNADMLIDFNAVFPCLWGDIAGQSSEGGVNVNWSTYRETNVDYFRVERSTDGVNFGQIGQVIAVGNAEAESKYSFQDNAPAQGNNYYRLVYVDRAGGSQDSRSVPVEYFKPSSLTWGNVGPNPTADVVRLAFYSTQATEIKLQVFDALGREVVTERFNAIEGGNARQIDLSQVNPGNYFVHLRAGDESLVRRVMRL